MKKLLFILASVSMLFIIGCGGDGKTEEQLKEELKSELKEELKEEIKDEMKEETVPEEKETTTAEFKKGNYSFSDVEAAKIDYKGKIVHGEEWTDKNGKNIMIFCQKFIEHEKEMAKSTYLYAYHYADDGKGYKLIREVKDFYEKCDVADHTAFKKETINISDLDSDDYAEITFVYRTGCNGDPTPVTQKLIMLEDGEKYAIRGTTLVKYTETNTAGGETKVDPSFNKAPTEFLKFAKEIWYKSYVY